MAEIVKSWEQVRARGQSLLNGVEFDSKTLRLVFFSISTLERNVVENVVGLCSFLLIPSERET
jgi:hypothetical protein